MPEHLLSEALALLLAADKRGRAEMSLYLRLDEQVDYESAIERARTPGELVWHYTTLDTLALILQSNCLLATEVSFQNDIRETSTADAAFREVLEALTVDDKYKTFAREALRYLNDEDTWQPYLTSVTHDLTRNARFILCASDDLDSLYAWRTYAQGGIGCAIGLDPRVHLGVVDPNLGSMPHRVRHWRPVVYQPGEVRQVAHRAITRLGDQWLAACEYERTEEGATEAFGLIVLHLAEARSNLHSRAKDPAFADEHEQRVSIETVSHSALVTTPSSMGPRPHVRLVASERGQWGQVYESADLAPKLPIRAVRLGPDAPDSAEAATQWLLLANGYRLDPDWADDDPSPHAPQTWSDSIVLDRSHHPYRAR